MFENLMKFFKKSNKKKEEPSNSKEAAKERLHLVLMQDRANVSVDFLELMKQEIIEVIKKYIEVDENAIDVRLTNKENGDGTNGAPALYANIPIINIKDEVKKETQKEDKKEEEKEEKNKIESKESKKETTKNNQEIEKELKEETTKKQKAEEIKQEEQNKTKEIVQNADKKS